MMWIASDTDRQLGAIYLKTEELKLGSTCRYAGRGDI